LVYHKDSTPSHLEGVPTYEPDALTLDGKPSAEQGYLAVSIPKALEAYGITERWNRREGGSNE